MVLGLKAFSGQMENQDKSWKRIVEQSMDADEDKRDSAVSSQISSMSWELSDDWSERPVDLWKEIQTRQPQGGSYPLAS